MATMIARHKLLSMSPLQSPMPSAAGAPPNAVRLLAFDSATEQLAVALHTPRGAWAVAAAGGAAASAGLLPQISALLRDAAIGYADLDAVAFGRGPGAFTGLRTACAVAQGIAFGCAKPVLPIDSLLIVADDARVQAAPDAPRFDVAVAMDARMDEVYAARYRWDNGAWQALQPPALLTLPALADAWRDVTVDAVAGSALAAFGARLALPRGAQQVVVQLDRAAALLRLALQAYGAGLGLDAALALPLYLRDKVALTTGERAALRAGQAADAARALQSPA